MHGLFSREEDYVLCMNTKTVFQVNAHFSLVNDFETTTPAIITIGICS